MESYGRIDWMSKLKVWKVIGYIGEKDIEIDRIKDWEKALDRLDNWHQENKVKQTIQKAEEAEHHFTLAQWKTS